MSTCIADNLYLPGSDNRGNDAKFWRLQDMSSLVCERNEGDFSVVVPMVEQLWVVNFKLYEISYKSYRFQSAHSGSICERSEWGVSSK